MQVAHPLGFTRRPKTLRNHIPKICIFLTGGAYAPYATCMATPLVIARCRCAYCCIIAQINDDDDDNDDDDETERVLNQASAVSVSVAVRASCKDG